MQRYNPFKSAAAQLSTPEAIAWYREQTEAGAARHIGAITAIMVMAYALGVSARQLFESIQQTAATPAVECTAIVPVQVEEIIDGEIVEEQPLLLSPAPVIQLLDTEAWVLNAITPSVDTLFRIQSDERAIQHAEQTLLKVNAKIKRARKEFNDASATKTETTAKKARKPRKTALAPQPKPTTVRVGDVVVPID